ncbi:MAG: GTPase ObgE [Puniceicoccaceae bacterium]
MFYDQTRVFLSAGNGGHGCASFHRAKYVPKGGPDGGDGGRGGDVWLVADRNVGDLRAFHFQRHWKARGGESGKGSQKNGRKGEDVTLRVPVGTEVINGNGRKVCELLEDGRRIRFLRGGAGGLGNIHFKSATNQTPREFTEGKPGQSGEFTFSLKTMADVGLIGFPNAGKSTLLAALTNATPKSAPYPFTTTDPHVGMVPENERFDYRRLSVADIPGLVEGASEDRGLGHRFLRHVERCRTLLFVIDAAGVDGRDPVEDFRVLSRELGLYSEALSRKPFLVAANKVDLPEARDGLARLGAETGAEVLPVSAAGGEGLERLVDRLFERVGG